MERRLGRGLGSLLGDQTPAAPQKGAQELPLDQISPNPFQPRKSFDPSALDELIRSIQQHGLLQPVVVRRVAAGFELVSGERRLRAFRNLGRASIPALVREGVSDDEMLELALVENVQRQDLDAIERARGFRLMMEQLALTQEGVADRVGLKRATVANHLRLLELSDKVQQGIAKGLLSMGHARALLALPTQAEQERWMARVVRDDLSVRQVEQLVRTVPKPAAGGIAEIAQGQAPWARDLEVKLQRALGTKVRVKNGPGYRGEISIEYFTRADLDRLCELLAPSPRLA